MNEWMNKLLSLIANILVFIFGLAAVMLPGLSTWDYSLSYPKYTVNRDDSKSGGSSSLERIKHTSGQTAASNATRQHAATVYIIRVVYTNHSSRWKLIDAVSGDVRFTLALSVWP